MKNVAYDFTVDSCVSVEAPVGTDPDTLIARVLAKLVSMVYEGDVVVRFENTFDSESGAYEMDWRGVVE